MAASALTIQAPGLTILAPTAQVPDALGNWVSPGTDTSPIYLEWTNAAVSGTITVTLDDPNSATPEAASAFTPDVAWAVLFGTSKVVKIVDILRFKDSTTGKINFTYSGVASLTVKVLR